MSQLRKIQRRNKPKKARAKTDLRELHLPDFAAFEKKLERSMADFFPDLTASQVMLVDSMRSETAHRHNLHNLRETLEHRVLTVVPEYEEELRHMEEQLKTILQGLR